MDTSEKKLIHIAHDIEKFGKNFDIVVKNIEFGNNQLDVESNETDFNANFEIKFNYNSDYPDSADLEDEEYEEFRYAESEFGDDVNKLINEINKNPDFSMFGEKPLTYFLELTEFDKSHITITFYYNVKKMKNTVIDLI